jgi:hypothetical protein
MLVIPFLLMMDACSLSWRGFRDEIGVPSTENCQCGGLQMNGKSGQGGEALVLSPVLWRESASP